LRVRLRRGKVLAAMKLPRTKSQTCRDAEVVFRFSMR